MFSFREIAKIKGVTKNVVEHVKKNGAETKRKKLPEKYRKTSKRTDRIIVSVTLKNRNKSSATILGILKFCYNIKICNRTLRTRLKENGVFRCRKTKKFLLNPKMIAKRLKWAKKMRLSMTDWDWDNTAWSDESMIKWNLYYDEHVYRKRSEKFHPDCVDNAVKHPIQIMIWGVINSRGVGELMLSKSHFHTYYSKLSCIGALHFVEGSMNSEQYLKVLKDKVQPQMRQWFPRRRPPFRYMHDLAPCHRAKVVQRKLEQMRIPLLDWPSNSPDMNPIENVWKFLKKLVRDFLVNPANKKKFSRLTNIEYLKVAIAECWKSEKLNQIAINCCKSMKRRINALITARGRWTKY